MTSQQAIDKIDEALRDDRTGYTFHGLRDRFAASYEEALQYGDGYACIKIPSGSEFVMETALVGKALGR